MSANPHSVNRESSNPQSHSHRFNELPQVSVEVVDLVQNVLIDALLPRAEIAESTHHKLALITPVGAEWENHAWKNNK